MKNSMQVPETRYETAKSESGNSSPLNIGSKLRNRTLLLPPGTTIIITLLLLAFLWLLYGPFGISVVGHDGETVFLASSDDYWAARWDLYQSPFSFDSFKTVDIYRVPESKVKIHSKTETFVGNETFLPDSSWQTGQLLFLYQLQSLQYDIVAVSDNATYTDSSGEFLIFDTHYDWLDYMQTGYDQYKKHAVYDTKFPISPKNGSVTTTIRYTPTTNPAYYFVTCSTPAYVTFSYRATVSMKYYNHTDYSKDYNSCTLVQEEHCNVTMPSLLQSENHIILGYVHPPSSAKPRSPGDEYPTIHIIVVMYRMLPPPIQFAIAIVITLCLSVGAISLVHRM